jgi:hypothetical protein
MIAQEAMMKAASTKHCGWTRDPVVGWAHLVCGIGLAGTLVLSLMGSSGEAAGVPGPLVGASIGAIVVLIASGVCGVACPFGRRSVSQSVGAAPGSQERAVPSLGRFLVEECRLVSSEDLERALARQSETGRPLGETLVEMGLMRESDLAHALRVHWGLRNLREE